MQQLNRKRSGQERGKLYLIGSSNPTPPNVPPSKGAFVPKCDREAWADAWLNGRASLMQLTRTNKGHGMLTIERAVLAEINNLLRRYDALQQNASRLYRRVA